MSDTNGKELAVKGGLPAEQGTREVSFVQGTTSIAVHVPEQVAVYDDIEDEEDGGAIAMPENNQLGIFRILQPTSPQTRDVEDGGLGVRPGTIYNTQTKQTYDGKRGFFMIVARTHLLFPEYIKREADGSGGGFLGIHEPGSPRVKEAQEARMRLYGDLRGPLPGGQTDDGKDIEIIETYYADFVGVMPDADNHYPGQYGQVFRGSVPFSSTNIPVYGAWQERQKGMTYPRAAAPGERPKLIKLRTYGHVWRLTTKLRKRGAHNWYVWDIDLGGEVPEGADKDYPFSRLPKSDPLYTMAADLRVELLEGAINLDFTKDAATGAEDAGGGAPTAGINDEIPFGTAG